MKALAGLFLGIGSVVLVIAIDKSLGISTKIVSAVGITPK